MVAVLSRKEPYKGSCCDDNTERKNIHPLINRRLTQTSILFNFAVWLFSASICSPPPSKSFTCAATQVSRPTCESPAGLIPNIRGICVWPYGSLESWNRLNRGHQATGCFEITLTLQRLESVCEIHWYWLMQTASTQRIHNTNFTSYSLFGCALPRHPLD